MPCRTVYRKNTIAHFARCGVALRLDRMCQYLLKHTLNYLVMFFVAVTLAYFLAASRLNPRLLYDVTNPNLDWDSINASLEGRNLNPDTPILTRYWNWLG